MGGRSSRLEAQGSVIAAEVDAIHCLKLALGGNSAANEANRNFVRKMKRSSHGYPGRAQWISFGTVAATRRIRRRVLLT
jgi:hypothetical protein